MKKPKLPPGFEPVYDKPFVPWWQKKEQWVWIIFVAIYVTLRPYFPGWEFLLIYCLIITIGQTLLSKFGKEKNSSKQAEPLAKEIQDEAIKSKHYGEWLEKEVKDHPSQVVEVKNIEITGPKDKDTALTESDEEIKKKIGAEQRKQIPIEESKDNVTTIIVWSVIIGLVLMLIAVVINSSHTPQTTGQSTIQLEQLLNRNGIALMGEGNYHQAITEFDKIIDLEPLDHAAYNNRGEVYLRLNNHKQAMEDFNRAIIAINHGHEPNPNGLASFAESNKRFGLYILEDSLQAKYYRNRGLAYEKLGNKNQAIKDLKIAARVGDKEAQKYLLSKGMTW